MLSFSRVSNEHFRINPCRIGFRTLFRRQGYLKCFSSVSREAGNECQFIHLTVSVQVVQLRRNFTASFHYYGGLYFNEKQTPDIYGKFNKGLEIKESQFYPTDEQLARGFGDDVLRVFDSCGPGAFKGWDGKKATHITPVATRTERIISYGPVRVIAEIEVTGWKYQNAELDMMTRYTLYAGHRDLRIEAFFDEPIKNEVFCTGVQDIVGTAESYSDHKGLVGSWGTDWPVNDTVKYAKETVGLGTCIPQRYVKSEEKDKDNYLYTITSPGSKYLQYHTTFTSMKETFGYKTPEAWFAYLREWKEELAHPVTVKIKDIH